MSLPWWSKIAAKIVLSRLPIPYGVWRGLSMFRAGAMDRSDYAASVFRNYLAAFEGRGRKVGDDSRFLELGPGDSLLSALHARAAGFARSFLVDIAPFASRDVALYRAEAERLRKGGATLPDLSAAENVDQILTACGAVYLTDGFEGLARIKDAEIDLVGSLAVLEHVRLNEFDGTLRALRRISRPTSVHRHVIDFRDHLAESLNNLRFSDRIWESPFFARSGFYTNRIAFPDMAARMTVAGFHVTVDTVDRWPTLPIRREALAARFRHLPEDVLCMRGATVTLTPGPMAVVGDSAIADPVG